jgi:putative membrane protein
MQVFVFLALFIALLAVVFALQNTMMVTVAFLFWKFDGSLALVLLLALAVGALISFLASLPSLVRGGLSRRTLRKRADELESNLNLERQHLEEAQLHLDEHKQRLDEAQRNLDLQRQRLAEAEIKLQAMPLDTLEDDTQPVEPAAPTDPKI